MKTNFVQSLFLSTGTVLNSALGLLFYILVARALGPAGFGHFSFLLGVGMLAAEVADWGIGAGIIKFGSGSDLPKVLGLAFLQRIFLLVVLISAALIVGHGFLWSAGVALSLSFLAVVTQAFLAQQKYQLFVGTNVFGNLLRLAVTFFLPGQALLWFILANLAAFSAGAVVLRLPVDFSDIKNTFQKVWRFSNFMGLSLATVSLSAKLDIPILYYFAGGPAVGIYSSAQRLVSVFPQVASSVEGVFSPKFSTITDYQKHFRDYLLIALAISGLLLIFLPLSGPVINLIFGVKYASAILVFQLFLVGLVPFFLAGPFATAVLYRFGKSHYSFVVSLLQLAVSLVFYWLLVPGFGAAGAAVTFIISNFLSLVSYASIYIFVPRQPAD